MTEAAAPQGKAAIIAALCQIMAEVGTVAKKGKNPHHGYPYVKAEDIAEALQEIMAKNGVVIIQSQDDAAEVTPADKGNLITVPYRFFLLHSSGEILSQIDGRPFVHTGAAQAATNKGSFDDKALNKCQTSARKYFLIALFQIPAVVPDADHDGDAAQGAQGRRRTGETQQGRQQAQGPQPGALQQRSEPQQRPDQPLQQPKAGDPPPDLSQEIGNVILTWPNGDWRRYKRNAKGGTELLAALLGAVQMDPAIMSVAENQAVLKEMRRSAEDEPKLKAWIEAIDHIEDLAANPVGQR